MLAGSGPDSLLFVDLETCGFAGTPVFLVGVMLAADGDLHVEQLLARNYEEEPAILVRFAELCRGRRVLTTFNAEAAGITSDEVALRLLSEIRPKVEEAIT